MGDIFQQTFPFLHLIVRALVRGFAPRTRVSGRRNIPRRGAVILAPNHLSDCDPPFIAAASLRPLWFMAKKELFTIPVIGPLVRFCRSFPVERGTADRAALRQVEQLLARGQAVVIFPEGQITATGDMGPIFPGISMLALRAKVPIIPVGLSGSNKVIPYGSVIPRPTLFAAHVHFGPPLDFSPLAELPPREQRAAATHQLEMAMHQAVMVARAHGKGG